MKKIKKVFYVIVSAALAAVLCFAMIACNNGDNGNGDTPPAVTCEHNYVHHDAVEPKFETDGNIEYYTCDKCNKFFDAEKNEIAENDVVVSLPIYGVLNQYAANVKGRELEIEYDEDMQSEADAMCDSVKAMVEEEAVAYDELDTAINALVDMQNKLWDEHVKAKVLADFTTDEELYTLATDIKTNCLSIDVVYSELEIAIAGSKYRAEYFDGMTDQEIDEYVASLDPEAEAEAVQINDDMEKAKDKYYTGETEDIHDALKEYVEAATRYAKNKGFDDYMSYCYYNEYGREYTIDDVNESKAFIRDYIIPQFNVVSDVVREAFLDVEGKAISKYNGLIGKFYGNYFDLLKDYITSIGDEFYDNFVQYYESGNYFYSKVENDNVTAYCWSFSDGTPLMFMSPGYQNISTFVHEFGHYNASLMKSGNISMDLCEVQSQGNEVLFYDYMLRQSPDDVAYKAYVNNSVLYMYLSVIMGYVVNELECYIYNNDFTKESLAEKLAQVYNDLGVPKKYQTLYSIDVIYTILLNYNGYYISYAVSAVASLELYALAQTDLDKAKEAYISIYTKDEDEDTFTQALLNAGLYSVFDEKAYKLLANIVE